MIRVERVRWTLSAMEDIRVLGLQPWTKAEIYRSAEIDIDIPPREDSDGGRIDDRFYWRRALTRDERQKLSQEPAEDETFENQAYDHVLVYRATTRQEYTKYNAQFVVEHVWHNNKLAVQSPQLLLAVATSGQSSAPPPFIQQALSESQGEGSESTLADLRRRRRLMRALRDLELALGRSPREAQLAAADQLRTIRHIRARRREALRSLEDEEARPDSGHP